MKITKTIYVVGFVVIGLAVGCSGVKFASSPMNMPLPRNIAKRSVWEDTGILKYRLDGLVAHVLVAKGDGTYKRKQQLLKDGCQLDQVAIDGGNVYQSKIDSRVVGDANLSVPILGFANKLQADQAMEVVINDTMMIFIESKDIPVDKLMAEAEKPNPDKLDRFWVQAVMLTQVVKRLHTKIEAGTTVIGATFGANGQLYNESGVFHSDPKITMLLVNIDDFSKGFREKKYAKDGIVDTAGTRYKSGEIERALTDSTIAKAIRIDIKSL